MEGGIVTSDWLSDASTPRVLIGEILWQIQYVAWYFEAEQTWVDMQQAIQVDMLVLVKDRVEKEKVLN